MSRERTLRVGLLGLASIPALVLGWMALGLLLFGLWRTGGLLVCVMVALLPTTRGLRFRAALGGLALITMVVSPTAPLHEYQDRVDALAARAPALSVFDCVGVWTLNIGMGLGGAMMGFPEVAMETLLLALPSDGDRDFYGELPLREPQIRARLHRDLARLPHTDGHWTLPEHRQTWGYGADQSFRAGLALDAFVWQCEASGPEEDRLVDCVGAVEVDYPDHAFLPLFALNGRTFGVDERLFDVLEDRGWLFPYVGRWHFQVRANDPRLADHTTVIAGPLERVWLALR